jgi:hypothetical protein
MKKISNNFSDLDEQYPLLVADDVSNCEHALKSYPSVVVVDWVLGIMGEIRQWCDREELVLADRMVQAYLENPGNKTIIVKHVESMLHHNLHDTVVNLIYRLFNVVLGTHPSSKEDAYNVALCAVRLYIEKSTLRFRTSAFETEFVFMNDDTNLTYDTDHNLSDAKLSAYVKRESQKIWHRYFVNLRERVIQYYIDLEVADPIKYKALVFAE